MSTPHRPIPDFEMSSARRPTAAPHSAADMSGMSNIGASASKEAEQRFARLVAENEYKLLEEKSRAHEREARLKEELARERAQIPKLVNERVEEILRSKADQGPQGVPGAGNSASQVEMDQVKGQLQDTQRLLADAERRYQQEKRELLNLRTAQLKNETSKRGQEGDIIGRAMQVMSEYETIVRSSEENSLARLAHHMESFEKEWIRRSREFEERKAEFESVVMSKALEALKTHNKDVEAIGEQLTEKTIDMLKDQGESRLQLEQQVLDHSETFKQQYKSMLDQEFAERCKVYDEKLQDREANLIHVIQEERQKVILAEKEAVEKSEQMHVEALNQAMGDISKLREQLVKEHQEQQQDALKELLERREQMRLEQESAIEAANERVQQVERQCLDAIDASQREMKNLQLKLAEQEASLAKRALDADTNKEKERLQQMQNVREEVEEQWKKVVETMRVSHLQEVQRLTDELQERLEKEHSEEFQREQELRRSYDSKIAKLEETAEAKWSKRLQEANRATDRHLEVIGALREDNEQLNHQLSNLQQQFSLRENEFSSKMSAMQREHEQVWHRKMEEMRQRYDRLLDEALGGPNGENVSRGEHEKVLENLQELEERLVEMKRSESERLSKERAQLSEMWKGRLEQERAERAVWEEDQMKKLAELRVEIEADARRKETELLRRAEQERLRLHDEAMKRTLEDRRDRDAFEERCRDEYELRLREAEEELNDAYAEKVRVLERRIEEKEVSLEKKRLDMKREVAQVEEESKKQAALWLEKEKEEILRDVKGFHEKLIAEQQRVDEERATFEQRLTLQYADRFEKAKMDLQSRMLTATSIHVQYWQECEQEWLNFRAEEMQLLYALRSDHERKVREYSQTATKDALKAANDVLANERAVLDDKESALYAELEKARLVQEAASRERAVRLLDERNKIQEEAEKVRAMEEAKLWEELEKRILEKERQAESERRVLEVELRGRYESLINSERQRVDTLMDQHRKEARDLYEKHESTVREREDQWHKQRLEIELQEKDNHERQYQDLRAQCENRVAEERARFEATLKVRESEFDAERQRILDGLEKQFKDHESATRTQINSLRSEYEKRTKTLAQEAHQSRQQYIAEIAEQEQNFENNRDNYEAEASKRFEKAINDLREQLESRTREHQAKELEAKEMLEKSRREYEERINKQYENLLKDYETRLLDMSKKAESNVLQLEREHQEHLINVRQDMEKSLTSYFTQTDNRARDAAESTRQQFQTKLDEYHEMLAGERKKRLDLEQELHTVRDDNENMHSGIEQHKLEIHRSVQQKFEKLFSEMRDKHRQDREELARKVIEDEEKRLARDLVRRDGDVRRENTAELSRVAGVTPASHMAEVGLPSITPRSSVAADRSISAQSTGGDDKATLDTANKRREKLQQLWQVLDYPMEQRNEFLDKIFGMSPATMVDAINGEIKRLEVQLPLLEVITRREYVQHRLEELGAAGRNTRDGEEFTRELTRLTDHLRTEIPKHEKRHASKFYFRGKRYLDVIGSDSVGTSFSSEAPRVSASAFDGSYRTPRH